MLLLAGSRSRHAATRHDFEKRFANIRAPRRRLHLSPRRFPPQSPPHPGRKQDDGARQVSWLPVRRCLSAFPRLAPQWHMDGSLSGYSCGGSRGLKPRSLNQARGPNLRPDRRFGQMRCSVSRKRPRSRYDFRHDENSPSLTSCIGAGPSRALRTRGSRSFAFRKHPPRRSLSARGSVL